ncbi:MAG: mechanosensitive ion channel family protein [Candidatus Magasanikbacteria bacterium]|nr:mechanosensitive ion channel family protein [Candidatus Magasanikbacteria bacterium]
MQEIIIDFLLKNAVDIVWIGILYFFGKILLKLMVRKFEKMVDDGDDSHVSKKEKRAETLGHIIISIGNIIIYAVLLFMVLNLFGVDIRPVLAGAGIIGLAVGFGAQSLVKDFVTGVFILVEDQYGIGDKVMINKSEGTVIRISMRSTVLKDDNGKIHYISNGLIKDVVKMPSKKKT